MKLIRFRDQYGNIHETSLIKGAKGAKGDKGDKGDQGDPGSAEIEDIDVITNEDIEEIVSD